MFTLFLSLYRDIALICSILRLYQREDSTRSGERVLRKLQ